MLTALCSVASHYKVLPNLRNLVYTITSERFSIFQSLCNEECLYRALVVEMC